MSDEALGCCGVLVVVPGEEVAAERSCVLDRVKALREPGPVYARRFHPDERPAGAGHILPDRQMAQPSVVHETGENRALRG